MDLSVKWVRDSMQRSLRLQKGFTIVELLVVIGIIATLFGLATINLVKTQHNANVSAAVDQVLSDIRGQQTKAMAGTEDKNGNANSYGIYFTGSSYILFQGTAYNSADTSNFTVSPDATSFSVSLPSDSGKSAVFTERSGELANYGVGPYTIQVTNTAGGESKTITINRYGVVTSVQ